MQEHARGAGGAGLQVGLSRRLSGGGATSSPTSTCATPGCVEEIVGAAQGQAGRGRGRGPGLRPREEAVLDLAQDGEPPDLAGAALRHLRLPRRGGQRRRLLPRARRDPRRVARRAWALQGLHLDAEAEQLPVDPHHHRRPAPPARGAADPHRGDAPHRRVRRGGARALQGRHVVPPRERRGAARGSTARPRRAPTSGCGGWSRRCSRATTPRSSWSTPSWSCSRTRCSASAPRAG